MGSTKLNENETQVEDSLEVSAHTPMYNPYILPLKEGVQLVGVQESMGHKHF